MLYKANDFSFPFSVIFRSAFVKHRKGKTLHAREWKKFQKKENFHQTSFAFCDFLCNFLGLKLWNFFNWEFCEKNVSNLVAKYKNVKHKFYERKFEKKIFSLFFRQFPKFEKISSERRKIPCGERKEVKNSVVEILLIAKKCKHENWKRKMENCDDKKACGEFWKMWII